ncbi:MAG TPA: type I glutamate--ammonia ligase, partial [Chloroflexi bacterium]|nr:type I glutamate--ammonia ligase [Chloroflexota bacterium]
QVPGSLDAVLNAMEANHNYLLAGDVFTDDLLQMWLSYKREYEVNPISMRPHPHEFALYFDI